VILSPTFRKLNLDDVQTVFRWLDEAHVKEFWDNSQKHRDDIVHFAEGRKTLFPYHNGIFSYWIGALNDELFCMIMTSEISYDDCPQIWKDNLLPDKKTCSLDFCIGNKDYLGKGFAAITLEKFTEYFRSDVDSSVFSFFIDPNKNNPRARHVYEKAGFKIVGEFVAEDGFFAGQVCDLMVKL